jgi:hypothetical protein
MRIQDMEVSLPTKKDSLSLPKLIPGRTRVDKVNAELVTLTYGTIVAQLCKDFEGDYLEVNRQLDKMGYNIGMRLVEDFLAKSNSPACANFRETAETISKVGYAQLGKITGYMSYFSQRRLGSRYS